MDIITPTPGMMHRRVAHMLVKRHGRELFKPLVNEHTGATITLGNLLMTLVLLGLWQRADYEKMKNYYVGRIS